MGRYHCMICGDDLVQVVDARGKSWWEHARCENDTHHVARDSGDRYKHRWDATDTFTVLFLGMLGIMWLVANR